MDDMLDKFISGGGGEPCVEPSHVQHVKVDETWITRAADFAKVFATLMTTEEVEDQFKKSDFANFGEFLDCNGLHLVRDNYIRVKCEVTVLPQLEVERGFQRWRAQFRPDSSDAQFDKFLESEGIKRSQSGDGYYRSAPSFPKIKLLEIASNIPWGELAIPNSKFVDFHTLKGVFQSEETAYKLTVLGHSAGFWRLIDPAALTANANCELRKAFSVLQLGIEVDPDTLRCYREWVDLNLQRLVSAKSGIQVPRT